MNFRSILHKYSNVVSLSLVIYFLYANIFLLNKNFSYLSLIDDGQTLQNSEILTDCLRLQSCNGVSSVVFESSFGRFRPVYWFAQTIQYDLFGTDASRLHDIRIIGIGGLLVSLLAVCIFSISQSLLASFLGEIIFISSFSFTENIVRLGPVEPYQLILLSITSLLFFKKFNNSKNQKSEKILNILQLILVTLLFLIKEVSIVIIPVFIFFSVVINKKGFIKECFFYLLPIIILFSGLLIAKNSDSATNYTNNYTLSIATIRTNILTYFNLLNSFLYPFFSIAVVTTSIAIFYFKKHDKTKLTYMFYWLSIFILFMAVLIPWRFVLERYLLIPVFAFSIFFASSFFELFKIVSNTFIKKGFAYKYGTYLFLLLLISNILALYMPFHIAKTINYTHWYEVYLTFEHDQTDYIFHSRKNVYLNAVQTLDNWEVLYEIPIHLSLIYTSNKMPRILERGLLTKLDQDVVLTSSSLVPAISQDELSTYSATLLEKTYVVPQINEVVFAKQFLVKPIQTSLNPPYSNSIIHSWKVSTSL